MNAWTKIPLALAKLEGPEELDFSDGEINEFGVEVIKLLAKNPCIKVVNLSKNRLRTVPPETTELFTLREVILLNNPIKEWPPRVKGMMNITFNFEDEMKAQLWVK
jgi:Leucine-rich repeat (LRR) protein